MNNGGISDDLISQASDLSSLCKSINAKSIQDNDKEVVAENKMFSALNDTEEPSKKQDNGAKIIDLDGPNAATEINNELLEKIFEGIQEIKSMLKKQNKHIMTIGKNTKKK